MKVYQVGRPPGDQIFAENAHHDIFIAIPLPLLIFDQKWEMNLIKTWVSQDWYSVNITLVFPFFNRHVIHHGKREYIAHVQPPISLTFINF